MQKSKTYRISTGKHGNVNFSVQDGAKLSQSSTLDGVLGHFLKQNSYHVIESDLAPNVGELFTDGRSFEVKYKRHHHDKNCWTISNDDALSLITALMHD